MRIAALGGAGDMGSRAVRELAFTEEVEGLTILDRNLDAAQALAQSLNEAKAQVSARRIDADDHGELVSAFKGHDIVMSAVGPFHRFESKLVHAALDAGVDYASISDEWEAAEAVFSEFDARARSEGRLVVTGLGASPGISNVCARLLANTMDRLDKLDIHVYQPLDAGGGEAVLHHMLHIMSGQIVECREGQIQKVKALSESKVVEFPQFGEIKLWNMGHSEPYTIPRFLPEIRDIGFYMGFGRGAALFVLPAKFRLFAGRGIRNSVVWLASRLEGNGRREPGMGALRIDAWGHQDGRDVHEIVCGVGQMREVTGLSLAVGTKMVGCKELTVSEGGVYAPEACFEPDVFFRAIQEKGVRAYRNLEMTIPFEV